MSFENRLGRILWEAYEDGCRRCEADLWRFVGPLYEWIEELLQQALPADWRDRLGAYLDSWEPEGFEVEPDQRRVLEDWVEDVAEFRGLVSDETTSRNTPGPQPAQMAFESTEETRLNETPTSRSHSLSTGAVDFQPPSPHANSTAARDIPFPVLDPVEIGAPSRSAIPKKDVRRAEDSWGFVPGAILIERGLDKPKIDRELADEFPPRIGASFDFSWRAIPSMFEGSGPVVLCELCHKLGVVQIYRNAVKYSSSVWGLGSYYSWKNSHPVWTLDGGIPYPNKRGRNIIQWPSENAIEGLDEANVAMLGHSAEFTDTPNALLFLPGAILASSRFDFELQIVCLDGQEVGATYGGIKWGYELTRKQNWAGLDWIDQFDLVNSYAVPSDRPSEAWRNIWLGRSAGR